MDPFFVLGTKNFSRTIGFVVGYICQPLVFLVFAIKSIYYGPLGVMHFLAHLGM